jgi:uncharacterized protein Yka (UPF0111/DUF47 family)
MSGQRGSAMSEVPTDTISIWETAVDHLRDVERNLGSRRLTPQERTDLLDALAAVDDAWEEHITAVRAWTGRQ